MLSLTIQLLLLLLLICLNGFLAAAEISIVSSKPVRLHQFAEEGSTSAEIALNLRTNSGRFLSTVQVGITMIGIVIGAVGGSTIAAQVEPAFAALPIVGTNSGIISFLVVVVLSTYLSLVLGELVPKRIGLTNPERTAILVARPMQLLSQIVYPFERILSASTYAVTMILGVRKVAGAEVTEEDLSILAEQALELGELRPVEEDILQRVFHLDDWHASGVMTPRADVIAIDKNAQERKLLARLTEKDIRSSYPVVDKDLDHVVGIVSSKRLLSQLIRSGHVDVESALIEPLIVPEHIHILDLLQQFQRSGLPMAVLINEFGGTAGIATQHDVLEAIVGDWIDYDRQRMPKIVERADGSLLVDGLLPLTQIEEIIEHDLHDEDTYYQTLGGFVMARLGSIPTEAAIVSEGGYEFEVVDMDGRRVDKVLIRKIG